MYQKISYLCSVKIKNKMKDGRYVHYQKWNKERPVALKFGFTEIAMTVDGLKELRDEIDKAINELDNQ